jgi:RimJ/RimL family protein N-acetyltransferase
MSHRYWPLFDLRVRTPRLELRYPDDQMLVELAGLAAGGIHDRQRMPFSVPWTRQRPGDLEVKFLQHWWGRRAALSPDNWSIGLAVLEDGCLVGVQDLFARQFRVRRCVETGSWLGQQHQGRGIGTEMRSAVLHLGFEGLRAVRADTSAFEDNSESQGVSVKLGYQPNGTGVCTREGMAATMLMFALSRRDWGPRRRHDIIIEGLEPCLPLLGLAAGG